MTKEREFEGFLDYLKALSQSHNREGRKKAYEQSQEQNESGDFSERFYVSIPFVIWFILLLLIILTSGKR